MRRKNNKVSFSLLENEKVVHRAYVGKKIIIAYLFIFLIITLIFIASLTGAIFNFINDGLNKTNIIEGDITNNEVLKDTSSPIAIIVISSIYVVLILVLIFHSKTTIGREYVLTDKRILISKGGSLAKYKRSLLINDITGIEKSSNLITNTLDIASIDFYGPSIGENKKTFLKIISLSSTPLKFQWIKEEDADIIFEKLQKMIYKK